MKKLPYELSFRSKNALEDIEKFLENHCRGNWNLELEDIDPGHGTKRLKVVFEDQRDKSTIDRILHGTQPARERRNRVERREENIEWSPIFERRKSLNRRDQPTGNEENNE